MQKISSKTFQTPKQGNCSRSYYRTHEHKSAFCRTQNEERDSMKSITSKNRWNSKTVGVSGCGKPECIDLELEDVRHSRPQTFKKVFKCHCHINMQMNIFR